MTYGDPHGNFPGLNHPAYEYRADYRRVPPVERAVGVQSVTVPIVLAVLSCFSIAGMAYAAATNLGEIRSSIVDLNTKMQDRIARLDDKLAAYVDVVNTRFAFVQNEIQSRTGDLWSRSDHELWCSRTELRNPGWKCGESQQKEPQPAQSDLGAPPLGPSSSLLGTWRTVGRP
jgi:hypothetical protein